VKGLGLYSFKRTSAQYIGTGLTYFLNITMQLVTKLAMDLDFQYQGHGPVRNA